MMTDIEPPDAPEYQEAIEVDIATWVASAAANPTLHRDRQVIEIFLSAVGLSPSLNGNLYLKGGTLMSLAFQSPRATSDIDFTSTHDPDHFVEQELAILNSSLSTAAISAGYPDLVCKVQGFTKRPKPSMFGAANFPAIQLRIAHARRGTQEEDKLHKGQAPRVLDVDISFRDHVYEASEVILHNANITISSFSINELIAEKLRALLQQKIRRRNRRQDVYDISLLLSSNTFTDDDKSSIHSIFVKKCRSRSIFPDINSLADTEVYALAKTEWNTLKLELGDLPDFDTSFAAIRDFYEQLPW